MIPEPLLNPLLVKPGSSAKLNKRETGWAYTDELREQEKGKMRARAEEILEENRAELAKAQDVFYASRRYALLLILQGMDASGKDGTIKHVMAGVNPQGCYVSSFKVPSAEEQAHDFLWRYVQRLPQRGMIGIFNRSYYEDVLVVRVHPEFLGSLWPESSKDQKKFWEKRFESIIALEHHLHRNGTRIIKCFLHTSREEQRQRLLDRLNDPDKNWKFSASDLAERAYWSDYMDAFEEALTATSTDAAPWWVVPADNKWVARTVVASVLTREMAQLDLHYPDVTDEQRAALKVAKRQLERQ
jgi:PPK2 family polyphosphate:nucleotide phosphotransferase